MIKIEDKAFLIHKIKFSETSIIASFLSENNGVYKGLIKGALNKKNNNIFEIGNKFKFETKVRNEDSLANLKIEIIDNNFSDLVNEKIKLLMILNLAELVNLIFPEKLNISNLFYHFSDFIQNIVILDSKIELLKIYSRFELLILTEMGYELDLSKCTVCDQIDNLQYISPRTGRAVCESHGKEYAEKLFKLPKFLLEIEEKADMIDINNSFTILGYFLNKFYFKPFVKDLPFLRQILLKEIK